MGSKKFYYAVAVLVSGTVGVGIFGVPFVFAKAGFLTGLLFLVGLAVVNLALNLAYGEIILRTDKAHQLVGYAEVYLGSFFKKLTFFTFVLSIYSALLAYIIVGGEFLANILSYKFFISADALSIIFFFIGAFVVAGGLKTISIADFLMMILYLAAVPLIAILGVGHFGLHNFSLWHKEFWFLPYGVVLFALTGMSSVVLQREVLDGRESTLKRAVIWGSLIPPILYLIFSFVVVGVSGDATSPDALSGLLIFLNPKVVLIGSIFGVLAIFTSFISLGRVLLESFQYDFKINKSLSWLLALCPPFLFFLFKIRNFINVIGLAGALALGIEAIIFIFIYGRVKKMGHRIPEYSLTLPKWFWYLAVTIFVVGVILTFVK